jgi:hypothetical protein
MSTQRQPAHQKERSKTMNMRHLLPARRCERVRAKTIVLALGAAGLLAISAVLAMATPASAAATVTRGTITTPIFESGLTDDCRAGLTGTLVGTDVFDFQSVETAEGFHFTATEGGPGRIDWSDGTYTIIESVDHILFNAVGHGTTVLTTTHVDSGDTYTADGVLLFRGTFHEVERLTVTDGVVRVEFERGRFHFFGGC